MGTAFQKERLYKSTQSATFGPTPLMVIKTARAFSMGMARRAFSSIWPQATRRAASIRYSARQPARRKARSSGSSAASVCAEGKPNPPPSSGWPSPVHSRSTMALMRGMLLFWLMMKVHSVSKKGWRSTRMPGLWRTHSASRLLPEENFASRAGSVSYTHLFCDRSCTFPGTWRKKPWNWRSAMNWPI